MITSLTTIAGMLPLMFETSFQAKFLIPMAVTLTYGLIFATGLTLIIVPCLNMIFLDMLHAVERFTESLGLSRREESTTQPAEATG